MFQWCKITEFNANELPSSLETLVLSDSQLKTFILTTNILKNLTKLDLSRNHLITFRLDLSESLPSIKEVDLSENQMKTLQIVDNPHHSLASLKLRVNIIGDADAYKWIYDNINRTKISLGAKYPICDCSTKPLLEGLKKVNKPFIKYCKLPLPDDIRIELKDLPCETDKSRCKSLRGLTSIDKLLRVYEHQVLNCTDSHWPVSDSNIRSYEFSSGKPYHFHLYLSGNPNVSNIRLPLGFKLSSTRLATNVYAENCQIKEVSFHSVPEAALNRLYLANNRIREIKVPVLEKLEKMKTSLTLAGNPLACDCERQDMHNAIIKMRTFIEDFNLMTCDDGSSFDPNRVLCFAWETFWLYFAVVVLTIVTCLVLLYLHYTMEVQVYIYSRGWLPVLFRPEPDDENYEYDVFVSYSDKDEEFVASVIGFLEYEVSPPFKLCHHHRDWIVGERID